MKDFQVRYLITRQGKFLVAGREGIAREVENIDFVRTPCGGTVFIADVGFSVAFCQMLSIRVAV